MSRAAPDRPLRVALLATPATTASTLFGVHDILCGARRDWAFVVHGQQVSSPFEPCIVARGSAPLQLPGGVEIRPQGGLDGPVPEVACITDLLVGPHDLLGDRFDEEAHWIRRCHAQGATVASVCSGAVLLAHTGLLDGLDATSHWGYCEALRQRHPRTRWRPEQPLVTAGDGQRLVMAGSGSNWHALALYLIARFVGAEEALRSARINILDWSSSSPLAYAALAHTAQSADPDIARCQAWLAEHYRGDAPVAAMARVSGLPERTFQRRFRQATGLTPLDYVHTLRLEEAKQMLETGELPVEAVALEVGYQDAGFFARLFKRRTSLTPAQYRRRFGALSRRLAGAAAGAAAA